MSAGFRGPLFATAFSRSASCRADVGSLDFEINVQAEIDFIIFAQPEIDFDILVNAQVGC